jgi:hypothetical protein
MPRRGDPLGGGVALLDRDRVVTVLVRGNSAHRTGKDLERRIACAVAVVARDGHLTVGRQRFSWRDAVAGRRGRRRGPPWYGGAVTSDSLSRGAVTPDLLRQAAMALAAAWSLITRAAGDGS